jgi:hypothetical protein
MHAKRHLEGGLDNGRAAVAGLKADAGESTQPELISNQY